MFNILYRCPRTIPVMKPVHCMNQGVVTWSILLLRRGPSHNRSRRWGYLSGRNLDEARRVRPSGTQGCRTSREAMGPSFISECQ